MLRRQFTVVLTEEHDDLDDLRDELVRAMSQHRWRVPEIPWHRDGLTVYVDAPLLTSSADLQAALHAVVPDATVVLEQEFAPPRRVEANEVGRPTRYVNTYVARAGQVEPARSALQPDTDHDVLVHIGDYSPLSLLPEQEAAWPAEQLPAGGLLLSVQLTTEHTVESACIRLPPTGGSTACGCPVPGEHRPGCAQEHWLRLPIHTGAGTATETAELAIYLGAVAVHVQRLELPVGEQGDAGPRSTLQFSLTRTFGDLQPMLARTRVLSIVESPRRVMVNGLAETGADLVIEPAAADRITLQVRDLLYDIHLKVVGGKEYSRYDKCAKEPGEFERDLYRLAEKGWLLFLTLFRHPVAARELRRLLRHEATARGRRPALQVVQAGAPGLPVPWSTVYGLPLADDPTDYVSCPAVRAFGPGSVFEGPVPTVCPYEDVHEQYLSVVCPFGFWGLSCEIEHMNGEASNLLAESGGRGLHSLTLAVGPAMDPALVRRHETALAAAGPALSVSWPASRRDLADHLAHEPTDVACLLTHCGYGDGGGDDVFLDYVQQVKADHVSTWIQDTRVWPVTHWSDRHPLVVLNGCHTVHATSATLVRFVEQFVGAGASGVIGPEVAITQEVASWAVELLVSRLAAGETMGAAVHAMRWAMLRRGNVMGLAYSPHCLVDKRYHRV